ncbi:hypothetical protein CQW31_21030 [Pseudomonas sp. 382]|nr:hypothetical protein DZC31_05915 [Stenotrophomonas rhizophila]PIK76654.1 hypothetical protein CQW31_21030 [Pseudomonas sp. 382]
MGAALCRERAAERPQDVSDTAKIEGAALQPFRDARPLPQKSGRCVRRDQLRAASTLAVIDSTEPTPSMWLYFGLPALAADSFW